MSAETTSPTQTIREALAAMKACIQSGEPWTEEMEKRAMRPAMDAVRAIETAAKAIDLYIGSVGYLGRHADEVAALGLLATIATKAPEVRHVLTDGGVARLAAKHNIDLVTPKDE